MAENVESSIFGEWLTLKAKRQYILDLYYMGNQQMAL